MEKSGWVIRDDYGFRHPKTGEYRTGFSWWYGPNHGWGNTWGGATEAATWLTKKDAEIAAARMWGAGWKFDPRRDRRRKAQRYSDAVADAEARHAAYLARQAQDLTPE